MTEAQKFGFYLPVWRECAAANHWGSVKPMIGSGEVRGARGQMRLGEWIERQFEEVRAGRQEGDREAGDRQVGDMPDGSQAGSLRYYPAWPEPAQSEMLKVLVAAKQFALQEGRAVKAEDLRHGCTWVATEGKTRSSKQLNNKEVNRVVSLLKLLKEPNNLTAVMDWLHPEKAEKRSMIAFLRKCAPQGTLVAIFRNAYGTSFWEDGDYQQLRWLAKQVKERRTKFQTSSFKLQGTFKAQTPITEMNPF